MDYPTFVIGKSRFDQTTFTGRLRHLLDITDPRTLFTSQEISVFPLQQDQSDVVLVKESDDVDERRYDILRSRDVDFPHERLPHVLQPAGISTTRQMYLFNITRLQECITLLDSYKTGQIPAGVTNKELWQAQKIKQSIIHPDTGEKIFTPFRMSGYVPFGTPIVVGMLLPNLTFNQMIFWQWLNQSHNACFNYSNRNATKPTPTSRFIIGYLGAVTSAISIAVGLSHLIKKANAFSPATKMLIQRFVPYPAVASANICNVMLMRNNELTEGIDVVDKSGNVVGTSKIAAKQAVFSTAGTRVILPAPILIIPPIVMSLLEKTRFLKSNPRWHLPLNAITCTISFGLALPAAVALFPQYASIPTKNLEPEIQAATSEETLTFNKGL